MKMNLNLFLWFLEPKQWKCFKILNHSFIFIHPLFGNLNEVKVGGGEMKMEWGGCVKNIHRFNQTLFYPPLYVIVEPRTIKWLVFLSHFFLPSFFIIIISILTEFEFPASFSFVFRGWLFQHLFNTTKAKKHHHRTHQSNTGGAKVKVVLVFIHSASSTVCIACCCPCLVLHLNTLTPYPLLFCWCIGNFVGISTNLLTEYKQVPYK